MRSKFRLKHVTLQEIVESRKLRTRQEAANAVYRQRQEVLQSLGVLTDGLANDIHSVLQALQSNAELLEPASQNPTRVLELSNRIKEGIQYVSMMTNSLRLFSGNMPHSNQYNDINELVQRTYSPLKNKFNKNIIAQIIPSEKPLYVYADEFRLTHIIASLISNANEAMINGGKLEIRVNETGIDDNYAENRKVIPGKYVQLCISDTGSGISPEDLKHIFEPYFTRKEERGHGLSLSTVHGIVQNNKGFIDIKTEVGVGTTFCVYLPSAQQLENILLQTPIDYFNTKKKVLVVDDEVSLRETLKDLLEGFFEREVTTAKDGQEALEYLQKNKPDILITDSTMPRMRGEELCIEARKLYPALPILMISGDIKRDVRYSHPVLAKPFDKNKLQERMMDAIGQVYRELKR